MNLLSKLRCITLDVTGTLIAYKGELGDYYCMAAKAVGLPCPDYKRVHEGVRKRETGATVYMTGCTKGVYVAGASSVCSDRAHAVLF